MVDRVDRSSKNPGPAPEHRLNVILEELQSQFRAFGEGLEDVRAKVCKIDGIDEKLTRVEGDVSMIKMVIPTLTTKKDLEKLEKRLITLETH